MVSIATLWLPIVLSTVAVFLASFVVWMVLPHHRSDWRRLPDEDAFAEVVRGTGAPPGQYSFPYCSNPREMKQPEFERRREQGPVGTMVLFATGPPALGRSLSHYFIYSLVVSFMVAYLAGRTVAPGAEFQQVFRVAGTTAWMAYSWALPPLAIWFGRSWSSVIKEMLDGLAYAVLTACVFALLWPPQESQALTAWLSWPNPSF